MAGDGDYGIRSSLPWAMGYPHGTLPTPPGVRVQPTPIYETVSMCVLAYVLWQLRDRVRPGVVFALYLVGSGLERFLVEFIRRNHEVAGRAHRAAAREPRAAGGRADLAGRDGAPRRHRRAAPGRSVRPRPTTAWHASDNQRPWPPARDSPTVFPLGSRLNELGRLEVGGCDTIELAREFGTPAYVVAEEDLRARARAFLAAGRDAGQDDFQVVFASKAFPCTAVLELFAQQGLWCDVASAGELHLALGAGFQARAHRRARQRQVRGRAARRAATRAWRRS